MKLPHLDGPSWSNRSPVGHNCLRRECYSLDHWWIPTGWIPANSSSWAYCDLAIEWSCMCYWTRSLDLMLLNMSHTTVILDFQDRSTFALFDCVCACCSIVPLFHYCIIYVCITVIGWLSCHPCDVRPRRWRKKTARSQIAGVADDSAMVYDRYNLTMVYSYKWLTMMILIWLWDDVNIQTWRTDWPDWIPVPIWPIFHQPIGAVLKRSGQVSGGEPSENTLKVGQAGLKRICCSWWLDYYCNIYKYL